MSETKCKCGSTDVHLCRYGNGEYYCDTCCPANGRMHILCPVPAEPSPEVAPMREMRPVYAHECHCGEYGGIDCHCSPLPAVAPRETQPEPLHPMFSPEFDLDSDIRPATQHRVIPVEWHRVAVEPGDDGPRVEPLCSNCDDLGCAVCGRVVHSKTAAQPATDDRTADTIPPARILEDLEKEDLEKVDSNFEMRAQAYFGDQLDLAHKVLAKETKARLSAETRIAVLEAALREVLETHCCDDGSVDYKTEWLNENTTVCNVCRPARAAIAAPSGEKP